MKYWVKTFCYYVGSFDKAIQGLRMLTCISSYGSVRLCGVWLHNDLTATFSYKNSRYATIVATYLLYDNLYHSNVLLTYNGMTFSF